MNRDEAYALARRMQDEVPGTKIERFPVTTGEYSIFAQLPDGHYVTIFGSQSWEDAKAAYEATRDFQS